MEHQEPVVDAEIVPDDAGDARYDPPQDDPPARSRATRSTELTVTGDSERGVLFKSDDPDEILEAAAKVASSFKQLLTTQNLVKRIGTSDHVLLEGWQAVGILLGVSGVTEWTRMVTHPVTGEPIVVDYEVVEFNRKTQVERKFRVTGYDWEARVLVKRGDGVVIGAGEGMVSRNESTWSKRDDYGLRSMAQTRASSKALRSVLSWIVSMAGYHPTPSDEMPADAAPSIAPASAELLAVMDAALGWLLGDPQRVAKVRADIGAMSEGTISAPAAQGVVITAKAFKSKTDEQGQEANDE